MLRFEDFHLNELAKKDCMKQTRETAVPRPKRYGWEKEELEKYTDFFYTEGVDVILGTVNADIVESLLGQSLPGKDPEKLLSVSERFRSLDDIEPRQNVYGIEVERRKTESGGHALMVRLCGEEKHVHLTREAAVRIGMVPYEKAIEPWMEEERMHTDGTNA